MIPRDDFTPFGYLDNPYHSWKLNPSGVLRSLEPLGMGWHVPNLGSYANNQFQYTAHLNIGLKIGKTVLITSDDFRRQKCALHSTLHTKNRFEYNCTVPKYGLTLSACYFLVDEDALRRTGDRVWLRHLYPGAAAYLRWWLQGCTWTGRRASCDP